MAFKPINTDWIINGIKPESVSWASDFAEHLSEDPGKLTTSQLRKFFGELKRIQALGYSEKTKVDFIMLKAKLAYATGRSIKKGEKGKISDFSDQLAKGIDKVSTLEQFKNFTNLVESIVAYHKLFENK